MRLLLGDCLEKLKELDDNSIDSIVTDPPYGLSFMGKDWDKKKATQETKSQVVKGLGAGMKMTTLADNIEFEKWVTEWSMECMRVLKPGGYMLAFGGSRMYHRLASGVENAGFEVRDQLMWIYGSGFPKSLNIGKGIDKKGGQNLSWFIDYVLEVAEEKNISKKELTMLFPSKNGKPTGWLWNKKNSQGITLEQYNTLKDFLDLPFDNIEEAEREVIGRGKAGLTGGTIANFSGEREFDITAPATDEAKQWEGWGTALKPAHEPIVMARKPLSEKTVVENVLEWGTGGINIEDSRIKYDENNKPIPQLAQGKTQVNSSKTMFDGQSLNKSKTEAVIGGSLEGRFPANVIFDEEAGKILDEQSGITKSGDFTQKGQSSNTEQPGGWKTSNREFKVYKGDSGGASRFFYCPKTSKTDRNEGLEDFEDKEGLRTTGKGLSNVIRKCPTHGKSIPSGYSTYECGCKFEFSDDQTVKSTKNIHPTVKPTDLMLYLIRLITPKGGTTLDPFMGSGSTGKAAVRGGFDFVGIEMDEEYMEIATARIQYEQDNPYNEEKGERVKVNKNSNKFW